MHGPGLFYIYDIFRCPFPIDKRSGYMYYCIKMIIQMAADIYCCCSGGDYGKRI